MCHWSRCRSVNEKKTCIRGALVTWSTTNLVGETDWDLLVSSGEQLRSNVSCFRTDPVCFSQFYSSKAEVFWPGRSPRYSAWTGAGFFFAPNANALTWLVPLRTPVLSIAFLAVHETYLYRPILGWQASDPKQFWIDAAVGSYVKCLLLERNLSGSENFY